uniref:C2H2-type domain-containing protein n=1 Tax=Anopheles epiroticus TaxID=199890 RepID=A0A182P5L8_9DIPT
MFPSATFATTPGADGSPPFGRKFRPEIDLHLNVSPEPMSDGYEAYGDLSSQSSTSAPKRAPSPSASVCALGFLPIDSVTKGYAPEEVCLRAAHSTIDAASTTRTTLIRKSSSTGLLTTNESASGMKSSNWIRSIKLASDVRSFNALLELTATQLLRVRLTCDVSNGEELKLWFSEDVIAHMQIPFLTPVNIQRQNCYVCHLCQKSYEYPNPLKIHLATSCNREPISILWHRLHQALAARYGAPFAPLYEFQPWRNSAFRPVLNAHVVKMDHHLSPPSPHRRPVHHHPPAQVEPTAADEASTAASQCYASRKRFCVKSNLASSRPSPGFISVLFSRHLTFHVTESRRDELDQRLIPEPGQLQTGIAEQIVPAQQGDLVAEDRIAIATQFVARIGQRLQIYQPLVDEMCGTDHFRNFCQPALRL